MNEIEKSILAVITWFDLFDRALTVIEIAKWRIALSTNNESIANLRIMDIQLLFEQSSILQKLISSKNGLYFLKGRERLVQIRKARAKISEQKFKKARIISRLLSHVPYVGAIAVCNSLGFSNAKDSSDIDFFIITKKERIFTVRFFSALFLAVLGLRPTHEHSKDKICLSFFVAEGHENLKAFEHPALSSWPYDLYLRFWPSGLVPLYNQGIRFDSFYRANNTYARQSPKRLINHSALLNALKRSRETILSSAFGDAFERVVEKFQLKKLPPELKEKMGKGTDVIFSSSVLKFHENDRRKLFHDQFLSKLNSLVASV